MALTDFDTGPRWTGGAQDDGFTFRYCWDAPMVNFRRTYNAGSELHVNASRASKISFAIDVAGVHLGQTSGHSNYMHFDWIISASRLLCGLNDYPVGNPGVIYNQYS
jgi:hypothetical protein